MSQFFQQLWLFPFGNMGLVALLMSATFFGCAEATTSDETPDSTGSGADSQITFDLPYTADQSDADEVDVGCLDDDLDDICNEDDLCPDGDDRLDDDEDGVPDACDACADANDNDDADGDEVPDACDICPVGDDNLDTDEDGLPDACDCDEAGDTCHENAYCVPLQGDVECRCLEGYNGDGVTTCDDIDECLDFPCAANADCQNNDGGFTCECEMGYYGDPYDAGCMQCDDSCSSCTGPEPTNCTACADAHFDAEAGEDFNCTPCTACTPAQYQILGCTAEADRVCSECTQCTLGVTYQTVACQGTTDRVCTPCTTCTDGVTYETTACEGTTDRGCSECTQCTDDVTYETTACQGTTNRGCSECFQCTHDVTYETTACEGTTNRACSECREECIEGETFESVACTVTANRVCSECREECTDDLTYETRACTVTTNRQCSECTPCVEGETYQTTACAGTTDRGCSECREECAADEYQESDCTTLENRACGPCDDSCETCDGAGTTGCSACAEGYLDANPDEGYDCLWEDAVCPNGVREYGEGCDEGEANGTDIGDCAPDCSRWVAERHIMVGVHVDADFGAGGQTVIEYLDQRCTFEFGDLEDGPIYRAMLAFGDQRRATVTPYIGDGQIDWVLTPFTHYVNSVEEPVWTTDEVPLLGVEDGAFVGLINVLGTTNAVRTGMNIDWTTHPLNCDGWTDPSVDLDEQPIGNYGYTDSRFLYVIINHCGLTRRTYCVEQ